MSNVYLRKRSDSSRVTKSEDRETWQKGNFKDRIGDGRTETRMLGMEKRERGVYWTPSLFLGSQADGLWAPLFSNSLPFKLYTPLPKRHAYFGWELKTRIPAFIWISFYFWKWRLSGNNISSAQSPKHQLVASSGRPGTSKREHGWPCLPLIKSNSGYHKLAQPAGMLSSSSRHPTSIFICTERQRLTPFIRIMSKDARNNKIGFFGGWHLFLIIPSDQFFILSL